MKNNSVSISNLRIVVISLALLATAVTYTHGPQNGGAEAVPASTVSDWLTEPTVFNGEPTTAPCEPIILLTLTTNSVGPDCVSKTTLRSGFTGGTYAFRGSRGPTPPSILTLDVELLSEVTTFSNGTYAYSWTARNVGTGALVGVLCGPNASLFAITQTSPLFGRAGADRLEGTSDDLLGPQTYSTALPSSSIQAKTVFCRLASNPTTERLAKILVPLENSPSRKEQCKDDGWQDFGFGNQGDCVSYVETGNDSRT